MVNASPVSVSVVIPTYNRQILLLDALQSVLIQRGDIAYEVLIVDNACDSSLHAEIDRIAQLASVPVRYIPVSEIGLHNGRNISALMAAGDILVYVDDDVITPPGWLTGMSAPFRDPGVAGVAGKSVPRWEGDRPGWLDLVPPAYFSNLDLGPDSHEIYWPETPYGCNMAYRRDVVLKLKGFSPDAMGNQIIEWLRGDGETGFARKVYAAGDKIVYTAEGWLYHRIPAVRMSIQFLRRRAIKIGISSFYMRMREQRYKPRTLIKMGLKNITHFLKARGHNLMFRKPPWSPHWVKRELKAIQCGAMGIYQLRLAVDSGLRRWVYREHYMPVAAEKDV